ncbi:hypothetical protein AB0C52_33190 [Streptomyces sp. NPDC048717]|uniref:hypothetical protein n=1 Tax=Streptomyces sp. NPDC048717 TaxID=3154928 RepID=UPI00341943C0
MRVILCGRHVDAVRVPAHAGPDLAVALAAAGGHGPVLADPYSGVWHLLTAPGTMESGPWAGAGIRLLRPGTRLTIPAADVTPGKDLYWYVPPGGGVTTASQLTAVLSAAAGLSMSQPGADR